MGLTRIRAEQISDIDYKQAVRVITVSDVTLSGGAPATVDGVSLVTGDRVLVSANDPGSENGIYEVQTVGAGSTGTWIRASDGNTTGELQAGLIIMVTEGDTYKDTQWKLTTNNPIIIGTTPLVFEQNSAFAFGNIYANSTAVLATSVGDSVTFTAGDNISILGNNTSKTVTIGVTGISLNSISNGTSNVNVVSSGGNVTVGIDGTSNVAVFSSTGEYVTGVISASGNITGSNVLTGGLITATGNITGGNILTGGLISATGNVNGGNLNTAGTALISGSMSVSGTTILAASGTSNDSIGVNKSTGTITIGSAGGTGAITVGQSTASQNILIGTGATSSGNTKTINIGTSGAANSTTSIVLGLTAVAGGVGFVTVPNATTVLIANTGGTALSVAGNITGGNLNTAGLVSATGSVIGAVIAIPAGALTLTNQGSVNDIIAGTKNVGQVIIGGTTQTGQLILGQSTATQTLSLASGVTSSGNTKTVSIGQSGAAGSNTNITLGPSVGVGTVNIGSGTTMVVANTSSTALSVAGTIQGGNLQTAGLISATGNISGGNINTTGAVSATGNITGGNILGNGASLSGINSFSNIFVSGGNAVIANSISDTLTITAGSGISIVADSSTDTITIAASGSGESIFATGGSMGTVTEAVTASEDLGLVTEAPPTESYDLGSIGVDGVVTDQNIALNTITGNKFATDIVISTTGNITAGNIIVTGNIYQNSNLYATQIQSMMYALAF
jgi:hypothetical protein